MSERTFKRSARRLLQRLGETCSLTRDSNAEVVTDTLVHISRDVEVVSPGETETTERRNEAELLVEDVGDVKKRDVIETETTTWTIARKLSNDGYTVRAVVTEG